MLPLTASSQNDNFTNVVTGNLTHDQVTLEMSNFTPSSIAEANPTEEETKKPSTTPSLPTTQTTPSETLLPDIHTAVASTYSILSQSNSSTVGMKSMTEVNFEVTTPATVIVSNQASNPTTPTRAIPVLSSSTQSQDAGKTSTSLFTSDKMTHSSTGLTQSTNHISTTPSSTKPASTNTLPVTGGDATQSPGLYKTSKTTAKTPFIHITKAKKKQDPPQKKPPQGKNDSIAVAGLIGGALVLMMVGFLVIYIKKRKLQKQQITTSDWAGPSPFLEGGADNGQVTLRSSNRISFSSFLPQRLSKRLSLLPETDEELEEIKPGTTFGSKHQGSSFGREVDGNNVKESNGTAAHGPEMKSTGDAAETVENSVSVTSPQINDALSTNDKSETANLSEDVSTLSEAVENGDGLGQP